MMLLILSGDGLFLVVRVFLGGSVDVLVWSVGVLIFMVMCFLNMLLLVYLRKVVMLRLCYSLCVFDLVVCVVKLF